MRNGGGSQVCPADRGRPRNGSERAFCRRHRTAGTVGKAQPGVAPGHRVLQRFERRRGAAEVIEE